MHLSILNRDEVVFPHPFTCHEDGLLCLGGSLSMERLLLAYQFGIFPWNNEEDPLLWWTPYPRMVLYPDQLKVSKSMRSLIRKKRYTVTFDQCFPTVIDHCQNIKRKGQGGTWITSDIVRSFTELHLLGYAHSIEVWDGEELVGGLYGVALGKVFFGESMFHLAANASKFGFITLVSKLIEHKYQLIDCQQETEYMASLGASVIPRTEFMHQLKRNALIRHNPKSWSDWV